jgi:hypothetical protein
VTSYGLHEMACARYSWRCEECGAVLPLAEKDKHRAVAHVVVRGPVCQFGGGATPSPNALPRVDVRESVVGGAPGGMCVRGPAASRGDAGAPGV